MPRRNSNALKSRTRNRTDTPVKALRRGDSITYVTPLTRPDKSGNVLVLLDGVAHYIPARQLISV